MRYLPSCSVIIVASFLALLLRSATANDDDGNDTEQQQQQQQQDERNLQTFIQPGGFTFNAPVACSSLRSCSTCLESANGCSWEGRSCVQSCSILNPEPCYFVEQSDPQANTATKVCQTVADDEITCSAETDCNDCIDTDISTLLGKCFWHPSEEEEEEDGTCHAYKGGDQGQSVCPTPLPTTSSMPSTVPTISNMPTLSSEPSLVPSLSPVPSVPPTTTYCTDIIGCSDCLENPNDGCSWSQNQCREGTCADNADTDSPCYDTTNGMSNDVVCEMYETDRDYCAPFSVNCGACVVASLPSGKGKCNYLPAADMCIEHGRNGSVREEKYCPATPTPPPVPAPTPPPMTPPPTTIVPAMSSSSSSSEESEEDNNNDDSDDDDSDDDDDIMADAVVTLDPRFRWNGVADNLIRGTNKYQDFMNYPSTRMSHCLFRTEFAPWVQIDFGEPKLIYGITLWHYWGDQRQYCSQGVQVSEDGETWTTIFDTVHEYGPRESSKGQHYDFEEAQEVQYIRHFSGPSNLNIGVHFMRIEVQGATVSHANNLIAKIGTKLQQAMEDFHSDTKLHIDMKTNEILQKLEQTCTDPTPPPTPFPTPLPTMPPTPLPTPAPVLTAHRQLLGMDCTEESLTVQCGFNAEGRGVSSDDLKSLFVPEGSRKVNTGFFYDIKGSCSDSLEVTISVLSNEVDERQSAFLTKVMQNNAEGEEELPHIYVAPRICKDEDPSGGEADDSVCEPSPSGKRLYDIKITVTDGGETAEDICRVIVLPRRSPEGELRGGKAESLSAQEQRELAQASSLRTVVGTMSLQKQNRGGAA